MTSQIIFIVWRESIEALLVIGILYNWLGRDAQAASGRRYLWSGVVAGLVAAVALAFALMRLGEAFSDTAKQYLATAMVFVAAILIVQMVAWMRAHGRTLKRDMEQSLSLAARERRWGAIFLLAMIAVAREGSETVVFLYGVLSAGRAASDLSILGAIGAGFGAAILSFALLQLGGRLIPWRWFFKISEALLLLLGCSLAVTGVGNLIALGILPYSATLWDLSWLLNDTSRWGGIVASLTGYRSMPDLVIVATWVGYWAAIFLILRRGSRRGVRRAPGIKTPGK